MTPAVAPSPTCMPPSSVPPSPNPPSEGTAYACVRRGGRRRDHPCGRRGGVAAYDRGVTGTDEVRWLDQAEMTTWLRLIAVAERLREYLERAHERGGAEEGR